MMNRGKRLVFYILFFIYDSILMFGHDNDDFEK